MTEPSFVCNQAPEFGGDVYVSSPKQCFADTGRLRQVSPNLAWYVSAIAWVNSSHRRPLPTEGRSGSISPVSRIERHHRDSFQQVRGIALRTPASRPRKSARGPSDEVRGRLPFRVMPRTTSFGGRQSEDPADDGERELQLDVHREGTDITKAVPDGASDREMYRLDLDSQLQAVGLRDLGDVSLHASQATTNLALGRDRVEDSCSGLRRRSRTATTARAWESLI